MIHGHSRVNLDQWIDRLRSLEVRTLHARYTAFAFSKRIAARDNTFRQGRRRGGEGLAIWVSKLLNIKLYTYITRWQKKKEI